MKPSLFAAAAILAALSLPGEAVRAQAAAQAHARAYAVEGDCDGRRYLGHG